VHYQPIVTASSRRVVGFEALARWHHPDRGAIPPTVFIPLAERSGLVVPLGLHVLRTACRQLRAWQVRFPHLLPLRMSVNVSARQLNTEGLVDDVARVLAETGVDAGSLLLEVTESSVAGGIDRLAGVLERLRGLGVRIAIDDFGTGYSSLAHLRRLPVDVLKIDRSFIDGIATSADDWSMATAVMRLARTLRLETVMEGVETGAQLAHVRALGCDYAQGYYFARPAAAESAVEALAASGTLGVTAAP